MKIGIVCYPSLGGSGVMATSLGEHLAVRGHEIHFITYEVPFRLNLSDPNIYFHQVEIHTYDLFKHGDYALPLAVKIAAVSKEYDLDILHVHYAIPHATSAYLAKQILGSKKPVVITTLHGTDINLVGIDPTYFEVVKFSIQQSCGVTAVSESIRSETKKYFGIGREIEMIHNFFSPRLDLIGTKPLRHKWVADEEKLILHSSNFRPVKRVEDVIRIFYQVLQKVKCKLLLLGTGPELGQAQRLVTELGLNHQVIFLGRNREIDRYVCSADLFLLPSSQESFGLAALEAMAYGIPVIASQVGGLPELIIHGESGLLAPVGDIDQMSAYAVEVLTRPDLSRRLGQNAMHRAREYFNVEKQVSLYENYYIQTYAKAH